MENNKIKLSIIIVSWNVKDFLIKCLESCFSKLKGIDFEVIVSDNASQDGTQDIVEKKFPNIKLIKNEKNLGFAAGNNKAIKIAKGEYVLLLNPDTEFLDDSIKYAIEKMKKNKNIGALGCNILNPDMTTQMSIRRFPTVIDILIILLKLKKIFPNILNRYLATDFDYSKESEVDQVMGAYILTKKEVFEKIGLLDEGYFIWFEEVDFCKRIWQNSGKVVYYPGAKIVHHGGKSFAKEGFAKKQLWFFRSALRFLFKTKLN